MYDRPLMVVAWRVLGTTYATEFDAYRALATHIVVQRAINTGRTCELAVIARLARFMMFVDRRRRALGLAHDPSNAFAAEKQSQYAERIALDLAEQAARDRDGGR